MTSDVIVIGGGIVGVSIAYHLTARGIATTLVDRADRGRATDAAAGIISADTYSGPSDEWARLSIAAADYYPQLMTELGGGDEDCGYCRSGILTPALSEDELPRLKTLLEAHARRRGMAEFAAATELREIDPDAAAEILPAMSRPLRVLYSPRAARIDGRLLSKAMLRVAGERGLTVSTASVRELRFTAHTVTAARGEAAELSAGHFVIAGGSWSSELATQIGFDLPVAPQRGQLVHLRTNGADTAKWPIVEGFRGHYVLPWPGGRIVAGATRESGSGFASEPTAAGVAEVLEEAVRVIPCLDEASLLEVRVGLRPQSSDGLPIVGAVPTADNVIVATGHGAHGLQLAPYTGKLVAELIEGRSVTQLDALSPRRFSGRAE